MAVSELSPFKDVSVTVDATSYPAIVGTTCEVYLAPTRFEDGLNINQCSEIFRDAITVLQQLNND